MPYIGKQLVRGQNRKLDDISSGFNGSQTTFTLQVASQNVTVGSALQLWISLGGVIQDPLSDYTIAGNQITFTTAPAASLDFFGVIQGDVTDTNTPGDATVTTSKLSTGLTVNLADGSAATSSLQLGGTDSGLFSSAADKVNVTTGGVERLEIGDSEVVFNDPSNDVDFRVESNGNANMLFVDAGNDRVGIGSSSPSSPLTVQSDSSTNGIAVLGRSADDISTTLFFENDGTTQIGRLQARQSYFQISGTDNTKGIFIDNAGEVGIGTSSPAGNLQISGSGDRSLLITGGTSGTTSVQMGDSSDADAGAILYDNSNNSMQFKTNASERMRIDSSGRTLVGTTTAFGGNSEMLQVARNGGGAIALLRNDTSVSSGNELGAISWYGNDSTASTYQECATIRAFADGDHADNDKPTRLVFSTTADGASSPTERMRIDSSGRLGIGTTSPNFTLDVNGEVAITEGQVLTWHNMTVVAADPHRFTVVQVTYLSLEIQAHSLSGCALTALGGC